MPEITVTINGKTFNATGKVARTVLWVIRQASLINDCESSGTITLHLGTGENDVKPKYEIVPKLN